MSDADHVAVPGVILDRDGTLIDVVRDEETGTITTAFHPSQLRLLNGVVEGLTLLRDAGFRFAIATNQPGPAKGHFSVAAVERTNAALVEILAAHGLEIAALEACMHHPTGGAGGDPALISACACRKPLPGMLHTLLGRCRFDPSATWMVGDSRADLEAGRAASLRVALIYTLERCELCPLRFAPPGQPDLVAPNLLEAARAILAAG